MPAVAIIPYIIKYWWVAAIIGLLLWVKIDAARLHSAQTALESTKAELSVALKNNSSLKSATDECNAKVDDLVTAGEALQNQVKNAQAAASAVQAEGNKKAGQILANKPTGDCNAVIKYGIIQAQSFSWPSATSK